MDSASQFSGLFQVDQALRNAFPSLGKDGAADGIAGGDGFSYGIFIGSSENLLTQWVAFSMQVFSTNKNTSPTLGYFLKPSVE